MKTTRVGLHNVIMRDWLHPVACCALALGAVLVSIAGCEDPPVVPEESDAPSGRIMLENQADHSGVLVDRLGSGVRAVTDKEGYFDLVGPPDGDWTLVARYPYFAPCTLSVQVKDGDLQSPVDVTLLQLVKFWVEPDSVVISLSEIGGYTRFYLQGYVENISDREVTTAGLNEPAFMVAFRRVGGGTSETCEAEYGQLMSWTLPSVFVFHYEPGEVKHYLLRTFIPRTCFPEGTYLMYWAVSDEYTYPEWLRYGAEYNETLYSKLGLFLVGHLVVKS